MSRRWGASAPPPRSNANNPWSEAILAVLIEVRPKPERRAHYLEIAASLKSRLEKIDGFISVERFQSLSDDGKILSLSFFRDEAAIEAWRNQEQHRRAQQAGRSEIFDDYRLRIASVVRDYGMEEREQTPTDSRSVHDD